MIEVSKVAYSQHRVTLLLSSRKFATRVCLFIKSSPFIIRFFNLCFYFTCYYLSLQIITGKIWLTNVLFAHKATFSSDEEKVAERCHTTLFQLQPPRPLPQVSQIKMFISLRYRSALTPTQQPLTAMQSAPSSTLALQLWKEVQSWNSQKYKIGRASCRERV